MALKLGDLVAFLTADDSHFQQGLKKAKETFKEHGDQIKTAATVIGAAAGVAMAAGIAGSLNVEKANDKLAAQLGSNAAEAQRLGKISGDLYAGAWGDSIDQVNEAVGAVVTSIDGMRTASSDAIQDMTAKALDLSTAFDLDVARAAQVAGQVIRSGLAKDGAQAMDLLTASMQRVPAAVREDLLDALDEYGPFLASIGVTGEKAFGLLVTGAQKGMYGIDKTGDALKEFTIRATDMSKASATGFDALGMSQEKMAAKLLKGGADGAKAFQQIIDGLLKIKDPVKQSQAALALFGTPLEDLSVSEIPKFLASLSGAKDGLGGVEGAAAKMGDTLNDNAAGKLESFKRKAQAVLVEKMGEAVPILEKVGKVASDNSTTLTTLGVVLGTAAAAVWAINTAVTAYKATATALEIIHAKDAALWVKRTAGVVAHGIAVGATAIATGVMTAATWLLNVAMSANPIGLIILAVIALVAIFVVLWVKFEGFRDFWIGAWHVIVGAAKAVWSWVSDNWPLLLAIIAGPIGLAVLYTTKHWDDIKHGAGVAKDWIVDRFEQLVGFVTGLPGRMRSAASGLFDGVKDSARSAINWVIGKWNNLSLTIGGGTIMGVHIPSVRLDTPNIPMLADGGIVRATPGGRMVGVGEGGKDEVVAPLDKLAAMLGGGRGSRTTRIVAESDDDLLSLLFRSIRWKVNSDFGGDVDAAFAGV